MNFFWGLVFFLLFVTSNFAYAERISFDPPGVYMEHLAVSSTDGGGTLIFSDSPEYVKEDGILYADTVSGEARVLYYHLNETDSPKKIGVLLKNESKTPVKVTVKRRGDGTPTQDFSYLGKETQMQYFGDYLSEVKWIDPGGARHLADHMDSRLVDPGELAFGIYDFVASGPVKVFVIMYPEDTDPWSFLPRAKILPKDEHRLRGTFPSMNRYISGLVPYDPAKDGAKCLMLVDDERDLYRTGIDATDGSKVVNEGNYGIVYRIEIPTAGQGRVRYLLAPLGGIYAGAMSVSLDYAQPKMITVPQKGVFFGTEPFSPAEDAAWRQGMKEGLFFLPDSADRCVLGEFYPHQSPVFNFSSPGAANLPVYFIMEPAD